MKSIQSNPQCLLDLVKLVPQERVYLTTISSSYTYKDVVKLGEVFSAENTHLTNRNCAVIANDRESLALYLPIIDSICRSLLLLPKDTEGQEDVLYELAEVDYVIRLSDCQVSSVSAQNSVPVITYKESPGYMLATSGTTGVPKLASYSLEALLSTAKTDVSRGKEFTWGLTYDINRFAGLQVYLQSISSGSTLSIPSTSATMAELIRLFSRDSVNSLSGTPSFWRKLLMDPSHVELKLKRITLGGEISNQSVLSALSKSYASSAIVHIYASTEAGVGFVVKDRKEGFPASYLNSEGHLACKLKVANGNLWIKSTNGCSKFLRGKLEVDIDGFINTGDMVKIDNDRVIFLGRESGSINVGGNKVMPEKVESVLEQHPSVLMAKVFSKSSPVLGSLVSCEIVLAEDDRFLDFKKIKRDIFSFCRERLESFEVPALLKAVDSIQTNATGKKVRN